MENGHPTGLGADSHVAGGVVDAVSYISILQIVHHLFHRHHGTVVLGLLRAGPQMGDDDAPRLARRSGVGEIRDIPRHLAGLQSLQHIRLIGKQIPGEIQQDDPVLHLPDGFRVEHAFRGIHQGHMDGDVIALGVDILHIGHMVHRPAQAPGRIHGQIRVVAVHIHVQRHSRVGHLYADCPKSDDPQLLALDFGTGEILLGLLRGFGDVGVLSGSLHPLDAAYHVTGRQQHSGYHQLFYAVGVGAGRIEHHHAVLRAFVQGDIVDAGSGPGHREKPPWKLHLMHGRAAHQDALRRFRFFCDLILTAEIL